jgi:hypothetical protein
MDTDVPGLFSGWSGYPLPGSAVRRALGEELARAMRHRYPVGIALIRPSKSLRGESLCELRYRIGLAVRAGDRVCVCGDDILIIMPGMPADRLPGRSRAIIEAATATSLTSDTPPALCCGLAAFPRDGARPETLLDVACGAAAPWHFRIDDCQCTDSCPAAG